MSVFHQSHLKNDVQVSLLCMCLCWEMKEILECPMWKLETRSMFETVGEKELSKTDVIQLTGVFCFWLWLFILNDFLPQNQLSKIDVKLVAKGSAGSWAAPNSRSCFPLPWFAQAAHRWQHPCWCSHQREQMAMGSSACYQPDGPAAHFTENLSHHSSFCLSPA